MDPELRRALEGEGDDDGSGSELEDDFVALVAEANAAAPEGRGFGLAEYEAHIARLMAAAGDEMVEIGDEEVSDGEGGDDDDDGAGGSGEDEEEDDDDAGGAAAAVVRGRHGGRGARAQRSAEVHAARGLAEHLEGVLGRYRDSDIGELDDDDPRARGDGVAADVLGAAMDEFMAETGRTLGDVVGGRGPKPAPAAAAAAPPPLPPTAAAGGGGGGGEDEDDGELSDVSAADMEDTRVAVGHVTRSQWDVDTVVSTYTNTENHPRVLTLDMPRGGRRRRGGAGEAAAAAAAAAGAGTDPRVSPIELSRKTGMPIGVIPPRRRPERAAAAAAAGGSDDDDDESGSGGGGGGGGGGGVPAGMERIVLPTARSRDETPEERRARKAAVKAERKARARTRAHTRTHAGCRRRAAPPASAVATPWGLFLLTPFLARACHRETGSARRN
jgi:protein LTV1